MKSHETVLKDPSSELGEKRRRHKRGAADSFEGMEVGIPTEDTRERLIVFGIRELGEHGLRDFSLRRIAASAGVSCAAPYRHFESKDGMILEIIRYINRQWQLLSREIGGAYAEDPVKKIAELCVGEIRFWVANPRYRSVLLLEEDSLLFEKERSEMSAPLREALSAFCRASDRTAEEEHLFDSLRIQVYGAVLLLGNRELRDERGTLTRIKEEIARLLGR